MPISKPMTAGAGDSPGHDHLLGRYAFLSIEDPALLQLPLDQCHYDDDDKKYPGHRRGIAHLAEREGILVQIVDVHVSGVRWAALSHHQDDPEYLKRRDELRDGQEE